MAIRPEQDTRSLAQEIEAMTHSSEPNEAAVARQKLGELRARQRAGLIPLQSEALTAYARALPAEPTHSREWRA